MDKKRVSEWELSDLNPGKQFLTDFQLSQDPPYIYSYPFRPADVNAIGLSACELCEMVAKIHGVNTVKVSKTELRVFKFATHTWEELTPKIREAFKKVYGKNITFAGENPITLAFRRLKIELKS